MSYFAFTATPKPKTLELFGTRRADVIVTGDTYGAIVIMSEAGRS